MIGGGVRGTDERSFSRGVYILRRGRGDQLARCEERVKILMTGGSGKTSVALWVAEGLEIEPGVGAQTVLVLVPTINLLAQTLREWRDTTRWTQGQYEMLCVCSDAGVANPTFWENQKTSRRRLLNVL
ncbi:hypothetical protein CYMTET_17924 [Cymbomonas tetramitiformis]|uniref:Helicase/UvrB N-terminal domain-containing protein n=1 Tax=Cymbomonas tetramitiformis TaxID=36881 RepID=A0AAE0G9Q2_9CHLO|nr:hypothetical protein CYMTET_17924 [Cymbomonas tetramitiformis]